MVTSILAHEGSADKPGFWREYEGGVSDWLVQSARAQQIAADAAKGKPVQQVRQSASPAKSEPSKSSAKRKLSYKEQRELDALPGRMQALEQEQKGIEKRLSDTQLYTRDPAQASELGQRAALIEEELLDALMRLEALSN